MFRVTQILLVAACLFLAPVVAQGAFLVSNGVTVFQDGYESGIVGNDLTTNSPSVGTWDLTGVVAPSTATIADSTSGVTPYSGAKMQKRVGGADPVMGLSTASTTNNSDVVELTLAQYSGTGTVFHYIQPIDADGNVMTTISMIGDNHASAGLVRIGESISVGGCGVLW